MKAFQRLIFTCAILFSLSLICSPALAIKEHFHATESKDPKVRNKALASKIWWNNKRKIEKIQLTEEQRKKMDKIFIDYLKNQPKEVANEKKAFKSLAKALNTGGKEQTRAQRDKLVKLTSESTSRQIDMMFDVVSVLSSEQRKIIEKTYPSLFSRLWVRSFNPAAFKSGSRERARKNKKPHNNHSGHSH